jgi:hypothetical protein
MISVGLTALTTLVDLSLGLGLYFLVYWLVSSSTGSFSRINRRPSLFALLLVTSYTHVSNHVDCDEVYGK